MKNLILFSLPLLSLLFLSASGREETKKFIRNNPSDSRAANFQGLPFSDLDGDGEADLLFTINGGADSGTNSEIQVNYKGPSIKQIQVSYSSNFETPPGAFELSDFKFNIGVTPRNLNLFFRVKFFNDRFSKIYSKPYTLLAPFSLQNWNSDNFELLFELSNNWTTNGIIKLIPLFPTNTVQFRFQFSNNSFSPWANIRSPLVLTNIQTSNFETVPITLEIKAPDGSTRLATTNFYSLPWTPVTFLVDNGNAYLTNRRCLAVVPNDAGITHVAFSSDGFSTSWQSFQTSNHLTLPSGEGIKTLFLKISNSIFRISSGWIQKTLQTPSIFSYSATNTLLKITTNNQITNSLAMPTGDYFRYSKSENELVFSNWLPFQSQWIADLNASLSWETNRFFFQFSNSSFDSVSPLITNQIIFTSSAKTNTLQMSFEWLPGGSFLQGQVGVVTPVRTNSVGPFGISTFETRCLDWRNLSNWALSQGYQFDTIDPSVNYVYNSNYPARGMLWFDAAKWCNALSEYEGRRPSYYLDSQKTVVYRSGRSNIDPNQVIWSGNGYRLPTEAEWEYACRGGTESATYWNSTNTNANASSPANCYLIPALVGARLPNSFGLYDMAGNVWEWCYDTYATYPATNETDPFGTATGSNKVIRGGSFHGATSTVLSLQSAFRASTIKFNIDIGFRVVLPNF